MKSGALLLTLFLNDISKSRSFYQNIGFEKFAGGMEINYLIVKNGNALIGFLQGVFENNILTFNPGWDENVNTLPEFDDVRAIQNDLKEKGVELTNEMDENGNGHGSIVFSDPDGNVILIDQHI
ncbi:MAG: VOC family protein [Salibacteraceae bacterium]|nr:VOC family protein [Salibacteraceae bacterium]